VTGHLPREHPHVADITHDDIAEEGVFHGSDHTNILALELQAFFLKKKAMRMSDGKHFDHILPFLQSADVHQASLSLLKSLIASRNAKDDFPVAVGASDLQTYRISRSGEPSLSPAAASSFPQQSLATRSATTASKPQDTSPLSFPDSRESVQVRSKEFAHKDVIYLSPQEHKSFKHGREVPPAAQLHYFKPQLIAQALAHHKFVFTMPKSVRNDSQD
jgi:hypothetical protein